MKQGISILELLIAMAMASVVFMIVGSILATFVAQNTRSERQEMFEQAKNDIALELSNNIRWAEEVGITGNILVVDGNEYRLDDGRLLKNGQSLVEENVQVTVFDVADRSTASGLVGAEITIGMQDRSYPLASDVMRLVVSQRRVDIDF